VTPPAVDRVSGGAVAWAMHDADAEGQPSDGDTIVYAASIDGSDASTVQTSMHVKQVMGVAGGYVVFNAVDGDKDVVATAHMSGPSGDVYESWPSLKTATAVSPTGEQIVGELTDPERGQRHCSFMLDPDSGDPVWHSCDWRPLEFSADGSRVLAIDAATEGLGPRNMAVLDAATGDVVRTFTTRGTFGRATFEDDDTIIAVVAVEDEASIVRCTVTGDCELATEPATVAPSEPDSVLTPYQLTAN
jgi:hypothetical protein